MGTVSVRNLSKAYKQYETRLGRLLEWIMPGSKARHQTKLVLKDISFEVKSGESVGLLGINGAGKSTLLKIITGTTQATTGQVHVNGRVSALLELGMGFHPDFTGIQNIYMAGQLQGLTTQQITNLLPDILDFADIGNAASQPVRTYSSGMQVRLAFSVATAVRPEILIIDEALSVGDISFQAKCFRKISEFKNSGTTLLFVTHNLDDIIKHCHRAILLHNGIVKKDGDPRSVVTAYRDQLFGRSKKPDVDRTQSPPCLAVARPSYLSDNDVFNTRPLYQKIEYRWGNGKARITDYMVFSGDVQFPTSIQTGSLVTLEFKVVFNEEVIRPVFGVMIKTHDGITLYGTNSEISGDNSIEVTQPGESVICKFQFHAYFNRGSYLVSLGITEYSNNNEDTPLDRRYDSIMLNITNDDSSIGLIKLPDKLTLHYSTSSH